MSMSALHLPMSGIQNIATTTMTSTNNREFVEGWTLAQTLGEGAFGE